MAAAFDDELVEQVGTVVGTEGRAFGNAGWSGMDYWTPNVNPFRDPRWGRGSETPGEDVLRVKRYAASFVRGLEGPGPERRIVATCKHYAGNDLEDWNGTTRHDFNAKITPQDLAEYYLAPFQQCARDSKVGSIMCSYNAVNGVPACADPYLLQTILRGHWNWTEDNNYVTSDCEAVLDVSANHHYASTNAKGTAMSFEAGMDNSCEYASSSDIPGASAQGLLKWDTVDRALRRLYQGLVRVGYFDGAKGQYAALGWSDVNKPEAQQLALRAAVEGIVLLKNDGTLPIGQKKSKLAPKVAMIGFWADSTDQLTGGYSGTPAFLHSPAFTARQMGWDVKTATGPVMEGSAANDTWTANALSAVRTTDFILYFGGLSTSAAGEGRDRTTIEWPSAQLSLIKRLGQLGKPLAVVQLGDQVDDTPVLQNEQVNAVMWAGFPGMDGGTAVLQLISGVKSPAGRLPVTQYPAKYVNQVPMTDMNLRPSGSNPGRTYRWYPTPIQPFGSGQHYTTFKTDVAPPLPPNTTTKDLLRNCRDTYPDTCALPPLTVSIANTGSRVSDYVVLAFVSGQYGPKPYPIKTLAAYTRLRDLAPGPEATARLEWTLGNLARQDEQGNTVVYPGKYTVTVDIDGPAQATVEFTLGGDPVVLDKWPALPK